MSNRIPPPRQPGHASRRLPPQPSKKHAKRDVLMGLGSIVVLVGAISGASSGNAQKSKATNVRTPAPMSPSPSPSPSSSLTPAQRDFVDQATSQYDLSSTGQAKVLKIGDDICGMLSMGSSVYYISRTITETDSSLSASDAYGLVNLATSDLCPVSIPVGRRPTTGAEH